MWERFAAIFSGFPIITGGDSICGPLQHSPAPPPPLHRTLALCFFSASVRVWSAQIRLQECDDIPCFRVTVLDSRSRRTNYKPHVQWRIQMGGGGRATPSNQNKTTYFIKHTPKTHITKLIILIDVLFSNRTPSKEYIQIQIWLLWPIQE